jgi:hypothetical protein
MLNVIVLSVDMLSEGMANVIMLSVVAPARSTSYHLLRQPYREIYFFNIYVGATTFSITTFSIKTLSIKSLFETLSITTFSINHK